MKVVTINDIDLAIKRQLVLKEAKKALAWYEKELIRFEVKCTDCNKPIGDNVYEIDSNDNAYCQECATARDWHFQDMEACRG